MVCADVSVQWAILILILRVLGVCRGLWVGPGEQDTEELGRLHHSWQEAGSTELLFAGRKSLGNSCGLVVWNGNIPSMKRFGNWHLLRSDFKMVAQHEPN